VRDQGDCFHLAIPVHDLDETQDFYVTQLGCKLARRYADRITLDFFGDQLVCHLTESASPPTTPTSLYPRHFGITFASEKPFWDLHHLCQIRKVAFFADVRPRFEGQAEEHSTFALVDPSGNVLEFKHYGDPRMMY
jgi:extradiol dioxygenase family protein